MTEFQSLGKINLSLINHKLGELQTDEIIVTNERLLHIKERHPEDFELFKTFGRASVQNPDYIIKDVKHDGTIFMIKKLPDTNLNVICRLISKNPLLYKKNRSYIMIRESKGYLYLILLTIGTLKTEYIAVNFQKC